MAGKNDIGSEKATNFQALRKWAEETMAAGDKPLKDMSTSEMSKLIHELHIHQVELEMQNEELRKSQAETERSRRAYQDLWELSPVGYLIVDVAGRMSAVNRAGQRLFGRPENALLNERFATLVNSDNQVPVHLMLERAVVTGIAERQEIRIKKPDGAVHICLLEVRSLGGESGREQIQVVLTDVTQQKRAEDDLRKNEQEKIAILDSLMEHVIYHDSKMKILWANKAACKSAHMKREDLLNQKCHEVWANRRTPCEDCPVIKARDTGQPQMVEKMTPDGRWWHIKGQPVRDSNGHFKGMTEIALDITKRKRAEEAVRNAKNELEIKVAERTAELIAANEKLRQEIEEHKKLEKALKNKTHKLSERVKELNCLFGISELLEKPGHSLDKILQGIVDLIPPAWQYSEITCAKIVLNDQLYTTKNFKDTNWNLSCNIYVRGDPAGTLNVCYLEEQPLKDEELFLEEEKRLLKIIAERLGKIVEHQQTQEALTKSEVRYHELFNHMSDGATVYKAVNDGEDFIFLDFNKASERIDKFKIEDLIGKRLLETYPNVKEFGLFDVLQRVWRTGKAEQHSVSFYQNGRISGWRENYVYRLPSGEIVAVYDDITERIQAQEDLRKSEARYRALSEATFEAIFISEKGICLDTNQGATELFGYDYDELIGIFGTDVIAPESKERVEKNMLSGYEKPYEVIAQKKDGTKFHAEIRGKMMKYKDKDVRMTVIRDINEHKLAVEALRESEKRYRNLFNSIPIGLYRTTVEGSILDVNPAMLEILGYPDQDALLRIEAPEIYVDPDDRKQFQHLMEENGFVHDFTVQLRRHDGRRIWVSLNATIILDANSQKTYYEGAMEDITNRKASEERIHLLSQQLMQAQEDERQMLSRELHDTVAQELSVAKMESDLIYNELLNDRLPEVQRIEKITAALQKTIFGVRNMAYDLRPPGLEELGLVETIYRFCEDFTQKWGLPVDFQAAGLKNLELAYGIQINVYRLVQEGLANVGKHAAAGQATVRLAAAFPNIVLRIEDNGRGFNAEERVVAAGQEKRMGLRSMQERVTLLNGEMKLQSKPGQGTKVFIKLPFAEKKAWRPRKPS